MNRRASNSRRLQRMAILTWYAWAMCAFVLSATTRNRLAMITSAVFFIILCGLACCHGNLRSAHERRAFLVQSIGIVVLYHVLWYALFHALYEENVRYCGQSSCTSAEEFQSEIPYNPWGVLVAGQKTSDATMRCPYVGCRWADVNGTSPKGYPADAQGLPNYRGAQPCSANPCANLATNRKRDWPDRGRGLPGGWDPNIGISLTDLTLEDCPGVEKDLINDGGAFGKGRVICSQCSGFLREWGYLEWDVPNCPRSTSQANVVCYSCVDAFLANGPSDLWYTSIVMLVNALGSLFLWVVRCVCV